MARSAVQGYESPAALTSISDRQLSRESLQDIECFIERCGMNATKIAHNTTIPALAGNSDLRPLQDLITAEKTVLVSLQRLSVDLNKASDSLRVWGQGEGDDLGDILTASTTILAHFSAALSTYASLHHTVRDNMKAVRTREEALDELHRRRRRVGASAESAEKKLNKMGPEHKNLAAQTELLNKLRDEMHSMDGDIVREEAGLGDYKRKCTKNWMTLKFGGLVEFCEKGAVRRVPYFSIFPSMLLTNSAQIVGDIGKDIIQSIPEEVSQTGLPLTENMQSRPPNQQAPQGPANVPYLPTPSLGSELTLNVNAYNAEAVTQAVNRRSSANELGAHKSARPLSLSTPFGNETGATDEDQSLMASIADALSQSHRRHEVPSSIGHAQDEPAPKYEPFAPVFHSETHEPNGHTPTPEVGSEGRWPRRNMRRSTSPPSLPPGAAPAEIRAWDDGMGRQGEDGAHSDRPASSSQRVPSQRRISSLEPDGEEEDGLAYDHDHFAQDEATGRADGGGSLSETGKEDEASVRDLDTKQSSPTTDNLQGPSSTSTSIQEPTSVNNAASTPLNTTPLLRAETQLATLPRLSRRMMDDDEYGDEHARNAAAAREVSRELDALSFSAISPMSSYAPPPGPRGRGPPPGYIHSISHHGQLPMVQASNSPRNSSFGSAPPSPLAPPISPTLPGWPSAAPSNLAFGARGTSPSSSPRLSQLDFVSGRSDSPSAKPSPNRALPEYPRPAPPFSSPLMAKSTSSLGGGGVPGGAPRTISAAAFRRPQARSSGSELGPADTSPLTLRRLSPSAPALAVPPKGPTRRLSIVNPDPLVSDGEDEEFDYIGAYSGGDNDGRR
ncbi:hypothetical protein BU15DRAFT_62666 [Melanogaster broomeanus]|nr:hypothetical protein BU15DRAFT_62666 [Melanogaster broomeanus]